MLMQFIETPLLQMGFGVVSAVNKTFLAINLWLLAETDKKAVEIGQAAQDAAKSAVSAFNSSWQELADGKSSVYEATVKVSLGFAAMLIAFWAVPFFNTIINEGFLSDKTISELIWPLIVVFALAINNGLPLASTCLLFRNTANYINNKILGVAINGIKVEQAIRQTNMNQAYRQQLNSKVEQCKTLSTSDKNQDEKDSQTACIDTAIQEVEKAVKEYNEGNNANNKNESIKLELDLNKLAEAIKNQIVGWVNSQLQKDLLMILSAFQMGFVFLVEIAPLLNAYVAPVFLALSLIPGQSKLIHVWLSGWLGLGLVKISYTLIVGIATSTLVNAQDGNIFLLPWLEAVLSPILALGIASGGGMALFNGLTSAATGSVRFLIGAVSKL